MRCMSAFVVRTGLEPVYQPLRQSNSYYMEQPIFIIVVVDYLCSVYQFRHLTNMNKYYIFNPRATSVAFSATTEVCAPAII